jgi:ankyrin repeat protein
MESSSYTAKDFQDILDKYLFLPSAQQLSNKSSLAFLAFKKVIESMSNDHLKNFIWHIINSENISNDKFATLINIIIERNKKALEDIVRNDAVILEKFIKRAPYEYNLLSQLKLLLEKIADIGEKNSLQILLNKKMEEINVLFNVDYINNKYNNSELEIKTFANQYVGSTNKSGQSLLHIAAINNDAEMLELLIKNGADVNKANNIGMTPLIQRHN